MARTPFEHGADARADSCFVSESAQDPFEEHRNLLFAVAYRMLGTAADAEDAVQDAWLRWSAGDRGDVADPKAYLVRITTNIALDRLRSARAQRETYVGPWLPEPILTSPDIAEATEMSESVSMAMLVVLETLSPLERAVFVLKEVFGYPYAEIGKAIDRSESSVRQLGTRARKHVEARRPRFEAGGAERRAATDRFFDAVLGGDINRLMEVLAPDVALWTDGGGKVQAARRVIHGADKVGRWLTAVSGVPYAGVEWDDMRPRRVRLNGEPGLVVDGPDGPITAFVVALGADGRVEAIHIVSNPDKLQAVAAGRELPI
ncbi:RNA polymerase sigma-70 factor [Actinomadura litoris]|uniref:RNA polymerase sigma-70 factor n=1 Tax=Actinomadura litoris TaxID=2678616 RepID=A0A7K1L685_9ACTN|nr:RNA polymerase sigma-70 factor [Actinomadura litoris]MBT2208535.1 RNA polymerase sigma-70 factor [Actinomadura sp. NEAU-AAG7]MUN39765.1 RNA polymerase sigma-70 factor [Actinomadura litoris]